MSALPASMTATERDCLNAYSNDKVFFFKYVGRNPKELDCVKEKDKIVIFDDGSAYKGTWIKLCFKHVLLFASERQRQDYHEFRRRYIVDLFDTLCATRSFCNYEIVGSNSAVSDIDVTLYEYFHEADDKDGHKLAQVLDSIIQKHHETFEQSLEELFDCNLYLTSFFYYSKNRIDNKAIVCLPPARKNGNGNGNGDGNDSTDKNYLCFMNDDSYEPTQRYWALYKVATTIEDILYRAPNANNDVQREVCEAIVETIRRYFPAYHKCIEDTNLYIQSRSF